MVKTCVKMVKFWALLKCVNLWRRTVCMAGSEMSGHADPKLLRIRVRVRYYWACCMSQVWRGSVTELHCTGGNLKCPKKHVKDIFFTWFVMHKILKCPKIEQFQFLSLFCSKSHHVSKLWNSPTFDSFLCCLGISNYFPYFAQICLAKISNLFLNRIFWSSFKLTERALLVESNSEFEPNFCPKVPSKNVIIKLWETHEIKSASASIWPSENSRVRSEHQNYFDCKRQCM